MILLSTLLLYGIHLPTKSLINKVVVNSNFAVKVVLPRLSERPVVSLGRQSPKLSEIVEFELSRLTTLLSEDTELTFIGNEQHFGAC